MDTLLSLRVLAAVAEHKSFSFVAKCFGLSPAMTSKHVQHVEARVGARLLNRNSRNVSLTEAGANHLATAKPLLEGLANAETQLSASTVSPRGTLRVSMPVWMAHPSFVKTISAYHADNPDIELDIDLSGRKVTLVEEGFDLALRVSQNLEEGLIVRKLAMLDFPLVASPAFLDKVGRPQFVDDLQGAPFIIYEPMSTGGRLRFGAGPDIPEVRYKLILKTGNETLIHLAAREGMGFAVLPHWIVANDILDGSLELVLPNQMWAKFPMNAVYPDRHYLPAKVRSFLDFLAGPKRVRDRARCIRCDLTDFAGLRLLSMRKLGLIYFS